MQANRLGKPEDYPGFEQTRREWAARLAESGFKDIEKEDGRLKRHGATISGQSSTERNAKARYYEIVGEKIIETIFDDEQERQIMCMYFDGMKKTDIKDSLGIHRDTVRVKIGKWLRIWGLK